MLRIVVREDIDQRVLEQIVALIDEVREIEGHAPVGEHKVSHLRVGARDWTGVLAYERQDLVGYAHLRWNEPHEVPRVAVEVVVHPDRHGSQVAPRLLDEAHEVLADRGGGVLYLWVHWVADARATLAARRGFAINRELAFMSRPLDAAPPVALPDGVVLHPYRHPADEQALLAVNNAAFAGHPENGGWTARDLAERRALPWFDPAGLLMAWRGDELLGFHWTKWHGHEADDRPAHDPVGEVYVLAVSPRARGLGLGRGLLHAGLAHLHGQECRRVILYVDKANTSALRLYLQEGFVTEYLEVCYSSEVSPSVEPSGSSL